MRIGTEGWEREKGGGEEGSEAGKKRRRSKEANKGVQERGRVQGRYTSHVHWSPSSPASPLLTSSSLRTTLCTSAKQVKGTATLRSPSGTMWPTFFFVLPPKSNRLYSVVGGGDKGRSVVG